MKKVKLIIASAAMICLFTSSAVSADGFSPGEGLYVGAFAGVGTGIVQPKVTTNTIGTTHEGGTFEATEGGLGLSGIEGGGWVGYGYKMGDVYAGLEGEIATGDVEFKLTSSVGVQLNGSGSDTGGLGHVGRVTEAKATKEWTGGMFGRVGYYVNDDTLLSFKGGVLVSKFDVSYTLQSETYYGGGPSFGASLESRLAAVDPNLNVRIEAVYTDYLTAPISGIGTSTTSGQGKHDSEVTGSALAARIGLTYSFFDVNTLF